MSAEANAYDVDANTLLSDPKAWQQAFEQRIAAYVDSQVNGAAAAVLPSVNDAVAAQVKADPKYKTVVDAYWPEVEALVAKVPAHQRTHALYEKTVMLVRGEHFDELAAAKAAEIVAAAPGVEGVSGSGGAGAASDGLAETWRTLESTELGKRQLSVGGKEGVRKAARAMNMTLDKYVEMVGNTKTTFNSQKPGEWSTQLVGDTNVS